MGSDSFEEKLHIALVAAVLAFLLGLIALLVREILAWYFERLKTKEKLVNLFDLYLVEVLDGAERVEQYIRQRCTRSWSRSRLSILLGPGKLDKAVELQGSPRYLQALFTVYRLFDLIQHQIEKHDAEEFLAIGAFIRDDCNRFFEAVRDLRGYVRNLHEGLDKSKSRKLFRKLAEHITNVRRDYWWGAGKELPVEQLDLQALDARFEKAEKESREWVEALRELDEFKKPDDALGDAFVEKMLARPPKARCKFLRTLAHEVMVMGDITLGDRGLVYRRKGDCISLGNRIAEAPPPDRKFTESDRYIADRMMKWEDFWKKHDPQPWEG
jgi:hypothetical protein